MCDRLVGYWIPRDDGRLVRFGSWLKCGNTAHDGSRAICDTCQNDPRAMAEIERQESSIEADNAWAASAGWGEF